MKNPMVALLVGLSVGVLLTLTVVQTTKSNGMSSHMDDMMSSEMGMDGHGASMTMDDMVSALSGLEGDSFDRAFIEMMIEHHQGAVDMAKAVKNSAKHVELKELANNIITTQTQEIAQMKEWQNNWGYLK